MEQETKTNSTAGRDSSSLPAAHPDLPADFYIRLFNLPACKRGEPCDGCGRCEHYYALGQRPRWNVAQELYDCAPWVSVIGDANAVGTITKATYQGHHAAMDI